jgi:hypothetical protein
VIAVVGNVVFVLFFLFLFLVVVAIDKVAGREEARVGGVLGGRHRSLLLLSLGPAVPFSLAQHPHAQSVRTGMQSKK